MNFRLFVTYTKKNKETDEIYSGKASSLVDGETNNLELESLNVLARRDRNHHKNEEGFEPAVIDKTTTDSDAARGREQMLIEHNGGAKSEGGSSGNAINSISKANENRSKYLEAALKLFGGIGILFLIFFLLNISM